ncbi:MAG: GAF domain-containing protein [Aggregatilineales bacterium]
MSAAPDATSAMTFSHSVHGQRAPAARARRGFVVLALLAGGVLLAALIYLGLALRWRGEPFFGVMLTPTLVVDGARPSSDAPWPGLAAGLRRGDRIIAIDGQPLDQADAGARLAAFHALRAGLAHGAAVEVSVVRPGTESAVDGELVCTQHTAEALRCTVSYVLAPLPEIDFFALFLVPYLSGLFVLGSGVVLLALRPWSPLARIVGAALPLAALFLFGLFDLTSSHQLEALWIIAAWTFGGALVSLALDRSIGAAGHVAARFAPIAVGVMLAAVNAALRQAAPDFSLGFGGLQIALLGPLIGAAILAWASWRGRSQARSALERDQSSLLLAGALAVLAVGIFWLFNLIGILFANSSGFLINSATFTPLLIVTALSFAYAALQERAIDVDRLISHALTYAIMLAGVVGAYYLLILGGSLLAGEALRADNPFVLAIVIFGVAALFAPVRARLGARIDQLYFRARQAQQTRLDTFAAALGEIDDLEAAAERFLSELDQVLRPQALFLFWTDPAAGAYRAHGEATDIRFPASSPLIDLLSSDTPVLVLEPERPWPPELIAERARLEILRAQVVAAFRGAGGVYGLVVVGPPRDGRKRYDYEQLHFLQALVRQMNIVAERALIVDSLERRVRELDVLSQVSQAINFTIKFDDLLELISAQAQKLIEATHFYIALYDADADELYYAFFLEDNERYRERENVRWPLGEDLLSAVVTTGAWLRVDRYAEAMNERGAQIQLEDPRLQAWMCVPLAAGGQTLGAMAAGSTTPGRIYTDEQVKIFNDIGALAAASLDKARLFVETDLRARQLSALNDISRQLVAAESDLEELLQFITASATDILDAEAGSLLLTADDGTGDLEFRVAIGGSGGEIIGRRLAAGRGLVGHVAKTGQPVIVNDVASDPRWGGELSQGPFQTSSVLAVPLVTQDRVIGVLEVLNKRGRSGFSPQDVDLLTAFAGQAAVAIENARLFQLTDQQLSQRLSELETLERIDFELNRSLDLRRVAQITVEWALENSAASAGLLGIVTGDPPILEIVYSQGYGPEDAPPGAEGGRWPLDRGIAGRVLRTRQADLVPDVSIDPDYVPSLRGGIGQIAIPMVSGDAVIALLILESNREPLFRIAELSFLQRLAEHATIAIANAQLYAELARANESKSEFVSLVAHELKNPLTSIQGYSDVLLGGAVGALSDQQKNFLNTIRLNAERMTTIVSDLNDITKLETNNLRLERTAVDFARVVEATIAPLKRQIEEKEQVLAVNLPDNLPPVYADQNRLVQVLTNLLSNAHKYTPNRGHIEISGRIITAEGDGAGEPAMLCVTVRDTGIGMDEADLARLFTPYFRSDNPATREQPGTGLGLTITRGIIEQHGGSISVESALGVGTAFHFTVPLASQVEGAG